MEGKGTKIDKRELAITALLTQPTIQAAAKAANVGETTLYRWLKEPEFISMYRESKSKILQHAITRLQTSTSEAVAVLKEIMTDNTTPANVRVTSAKTILELSLKAFEMENIIQRVEELERIMEKGA